MSEMREFHDELRSVAREVLAGSPDWPALVELGWTGLEVPESLDGSGATFAETAVVLRELGRAASPVPFLGTVLAVAALSEAGADDILGAVARGEQRPCVVFAGEGDDLVVDAPDADVVLVIGKGELQHVRATVDEQPVLDATRRLGTVRVDEVVASWELPFGARERLLDRAAVAVAVDSLGVAEAMLDVTVEYAKVRTQFDAPIGSFQAVKHACADMLVAVTIGQELVQTAVNEPDWVTAAQAKSFVTAAAVDVVGKAMQLHGGIGYTWESPVHVYFKRAALNRSLFGSPTEHRRRLAARYGIRTASPAP